MQNNIQNRDEYPSFLSTALAIHGSITPKVLKNVFYVLIYSFLVSMLSYQFPAIKIQTGPFEYAGLILGLILVFRINAGYDRWWEARKIWGDVVNKTRNLAVLVLSQPNDISLEEKKALVRLAQVTPYLIKKHLRNEDSLEDVKQLAATINPKIDAVKSNRTLFVSSLMAKKLSALLHEKRLSPFVFLQIEKQREKIIDCQGACERILTTPMPFVMAVKSRRFILIFILLLPFSLIHSSLYLSPLIMSVVSYALFSLDQIGIELQNPFQESNLSHHPLMHICNKIQTDLEALITASERQR